MQISFSYLKIFNVVFSFVDESRLYHEKFNGFQKEIDEIREAMYEYFQPTIKVIWSVT